MTCADTRNATSSLESADGVTPCDSPAGPTTDLFGQALVPASLSVPQANSVAAKMSATYGLRSSASSASVALQQSLANRLQERLASRGSTMFALTWKAQATPQRRQICRLAASAPRTGDSGFGGWPTPNSGPQNDTDTRRQERRAEVKAKGINGNGFGMTLGMAASMTAWPTPTAQDHFSANATANRSNPDSQHHAGTTLTDAARFAGCTTPSAHDWKDTGPIKDRADGSARLDQLPRQAHLINGPTSNGSPAPTERRGQLNPSFSRWLMGYGITWDIAAMEIDSSSRRSSKARKTESEGSGPTGTQ
jgi:hypothetical protein